MTARYPSPRWQTPLPPGVVGSWGPDVAAAAERILGIRLDRWQRRALNRALAFGDDGRLVHRLYLVSTARQNGKTALVRSLIDWALTTPYGPPWAMLLGLAHDKRQARIPYKAVRADLEPIARRLGPTGRGGLNLTTYLGIRSTMYGRSREYDVASREAADAIRGLSVDLAIFDEIRTQRGDDTWAALAPTTTARPDPLVFGISTAGNDRSVLLRDWFDRGIRIIDGIEPAEGFGMTWYAPPDHLAPDDPRAWRAASPAMADGRIDPAAILAEYRSLSPSAFRMERLNLWADAGDEWLPAGTWVETTRPEPPDRSTADRVVIGVEAVPTWRRASITVAVATPDGAWAGMAGELVAGRTVAPTVSPGDLVARVRELVATWRPSMLVYSKSAAAAPHLAAIEVDGLTHVALTPGQLRQASELFRSELIGRRLTHADDPLLARQSRDARPSAEIESGSWYIGIHQSAGDVDALRALAWAAWAAIAPPEPEPPGHGIHL